MNSFYPHDELKGLGLASCGENVLISRKASIYGAENIRIGNNVRVDDFCILSGKITIGNYIHIAAYTALYGGDKGIDIHDFSDLSAKILVYSVCSDFSGQTMTNPMVPERYKKLQSEKVVIEQHVLIGASCVVLPGVILKEGSAFGSMSLINKSSEPWSINAGILFRKLRDRSKELLKLKKEFQKDCL